MKTFEIYADVLMGHKYIIEARSEAVAMKMVQSGDLNPDSSHLATSPIITSIQEIDNDQQ